MRSVESTDICEVALADVVLREQGIYMQRVRASIGYSLVSIGHDTYMLLSKHTPPCAIYPIRC